MTIAAILALAVVALAGGAYAYLVYSPKPQMPSLSSEVQHATMRVGDRERSYPAHCIFPSSRLRREVPSLVTLLDERPVASRWTVTSAAAARSSIASSGWPRARCARMSSPAS
jgi:hypothetical protein